MPLSRRKIIRRFYLGPEKSKMIFGFDKFTSERLREDPDFRKDFERIKLNLKRGNITVEKANELFFKVLDKSFKRAKKQKLVA